MPRDAIPVSGDGPGRRGWRLIRAASVAALLLAAGGARAEPDLVDAARRVSGLVTEIRYAGRHNFVGRPIAGYEAPLCLLTPAAAAALARAQAALERDGLGLKVFDCYRPLRAVADFVRWARDTADVSGKAEFYPDLDKGDLFRLGYIAERSAHSRGSTVDITLVERATGRERPMGTPFDLFGPRSGEGAALSDEARANRARLREAMSAAGFTPYAPEWWHFTLRDEPHRTQGFDVPVRAPEP
ncbi:D-alanyl-D-alanine dipeptidase [Methylobacterium sp. BE186]|uniref:M15 family metallopeptidase n=1 Tax=Methylobacterium sp. BE186 TaxID=2817715 RepID=UPI00285D243A|nr:M15 family metallopeptidase [Methylobacterium sp. BE186]MDR7036141.1 D-alanyl-D-alanine dipeptidase [Methylobacterium sp. BE186]